MSSTQLSDKQPAGTYISKNLKIGFDSKTIDEISGSSSDPLIKTENSEALTCATKQKNLVETDDSFDIFLPLKVKNYKNGFKNSNPVCSPKKLKKKKIVSSSRICPYFSSRKSPTSSREDKDLQLALARSLADVSHSETSDNFLQAVTNERNASKQNSDFLKSLTSKAKKSGIKSLLFRRTVEERQNILTKKIAIVLIGKENIKDECFQKQDVELVSSILEEAWDKESDQVSSDVMDIKRENDSDELDGDKTNSDEDGREYDKELDFTECKTFNKSQVINDSLHKLSEDFLEIFDTNELSDIKVMLSTAEILPCHQFIIQVRCPCVLINSEHSKLPNTLDFTQYSARATKAFFKYIYSGKIEFIYNMVNEDKNDLYILAKKYNLEFLEKFLLSAFRSDSFHLYSQSTCSPPHSSRGSPDSSQGPKDIISNKFKEFPSSPLNSCSEEELKPSIIEDHQQEKISFINAIESISGEPLSSALSSSQNKTNFERNFAFFSGDNSSYDIFRDEIKSPCNSSVLHQNTSQSKRKLDYSGILNESKKLCSGKIADNLSSLDIITLDSDNEHSNTSSDHSSFVKVKQDSDEISGNSCNLSFAKPSCTVKVENVTNEALETSSRPTAAPPLTVSNSPIRSSLLLIKAPSQRNDRSFDKYFEASFPEINENIENIESSSKPKTLGTPPIIRNPSKDVLTPLREIIIDDATPKPDYSAMISPELKAELRKYGIKPDLDHRKARALLRYIYEQIHPIRSELPRYNSPVPSTSKERSSPVIVIDDDSNQSDKADIARMNSETDFAYEEYLFNQSKEWNEISPKQDESDLRKTVINFIKSDDELFSNVVLFRPLLLKKFYKTFKEHGVQCSLHELMDVLDDLCVNYHVEKTESSQKRRNNRKPVPRKQQKHF